MRKIILIIIGILVVTSASLWFIFSSHSKLYSENSAFKAVSLRSPIVIEIPDIEDFLQTIYGDAEVMEQLQTTPFLANLYRQLNWFNDCFNSNEELRDFLDDKCLLVSYNHQGKDGVVPLYACSLEKAIEENTMLKALKNYAQDANLNYNSIKYDQQELYSIDFPIIGKQFYACQSGIFTMSSSRLLVEEAMRQIDTSNLMTNEQFNNLYGTVNHSSLFNVFVNHEQIPELLNRIVNRNYHSVVNDIATFAHWSEYDVSNNDNQFWLNGYSIIEEAHDNFLSVLSQQSPQRFNIDEAISSNASLFINLNLSSFNKFQEDYASYLKLQNEAFYERETRLLEIERKFGKHLLNAFSKFTNQDFALVFGSIIQNNPEANRYLIAETKSKSIARDELMPILTTYAETKGVDLSNITTTYTLDQKESYDIYEFPITDCAQILFGQVFAGVTCNYLCFYNNYLIFADNIESMKSYIHDLVLRSTLQKDERFINFNREMSSNSNFYAYLNFSKFFNAHTLYLENSSSTIAQENETNIRKFQAIGWQISTVNDKFLNNLYLNFNPKLKEDPQAVWASQLDAPINTKPVFVKNHLDPQNKEVIVQDQANNLYLINKEGVPVWKIKIDAKILGNIQQIDIYKNNRFQYIFNTRNKIYIIDRNGNNVSKFPVALRSPATNSVSIFDYTNNGNYRFLLACEDKQVYVYDKTGNTITGWKAEKTDAIVTNPIQYRLINNKDYIFYTDLHNTYIVSRTGESRDKQIERFEHSNNDIYFITTEGKPAIATTDTKGIIHMQFINGGHKTVKFANFGSDHKFVAQDLDNDGLDDFIFASKQILVAFDSSGKQLFETKFKSDISTTPIILSFGKNDVRIGVTTADKNQIHLLTLNGKEYDGFPLQGNTDFSIGKFSNNQEYFNVLVGNNNSGFLNYMIQ